MDTQPTRTEIEALANVRRIAREADEAGMPSLSVAAKNAERVLIDSIAQRIALEVQAEVRRSL